MDCFDLQLICWQADSGRNITMLTYWQRGGNNLITVIQTLNLRKEKIPLYNQTFA